MNIALLGCGVVGGGVLEIADKRADMSVKYVLVRRDKPELGAKAVKDISIILNDKEVDTVVEVMGGLSPAFEYVTAAMRAGKNVVTANKHLVAHYYKELVSLAAECGVAFRCTPAVGGGIPWLVNLERVKRLDSVQSFCGIMNGTTNFILDAMHTDGSDFSEVLAEAQKLGYAEADPAADVSGLDALRKIMLGCAVGFDALPDEGLDREGIESFTAADVADLKKRGLTCRLVARGGRTDGGVYAYVEPVLFTAAAPECSVLDNFNLARYHGEDSGDIVMIGQGAGRWPTASAVLRDLSCVLRGEREMLGAGCVRCAADNEGCVHSYYVRLPEKLVSELPVKSAKNENGVARVITEPVSVASIHAFAAKQRENGAEIFFAAVEE